MSLHTPAGAKLLWELGAQRVVLSREMSLGEIREVGQACPVGGWKALSTGRCVCPCRGGAGSAPCWEAAAATGACVPSPAGCPSRRLVARATTCL